MEPLLRFGEALVAAQVLGDHHRDVEEDLPVVVRVGQRAGDVEGVVEIRELDAAACNRRVVVREERLRLRLECRVEQRGDRALLALLDHVAEARVEEVIARVGELVQLDTLSNRDRDEIAGVVKVAEFGHAGHDYCPPLRSVVWAGAVSAPLAPSDWPWY